MKNEVSPRCPFCPADPTQEKFQVPKLGNSCKFSQFRDNIGEKLGMKLPKLGKFCKLNHFQDHRKGIFWDNIIIIFSKLHFGNIMGIYPILAKNWDMNFLLCENIGQKIGKILSRRKQKLLFWENIGKSEEFTPLVPIFFGFGKCFSKNIGNRVVKCFWIFPNLGRNGTQLSYGGKSLDEKLDQVKVTVEINFLFLSPSPPSLRKKESGVALGTKMPQFSFPACTQERPARFKLPFRRWLCFLLHPHKIQTQSQRKRIKMNEKNNLRIF